MLDQNNSKENDQVLPSDGFPRVTVRVEISIDNAPGAIFTCEEDRALMDISPGQWDHKYSKMMLAKVVDNFGIAMKNAGRLAGIDHEQV